MKHYGPKEHHGMIGRFRHCSACGPYLSVLIAFAAAGICSAAQVVIARELPLAPFRYAEGFEDSAPSTFSHGSGGYTVNFKGLTSEKSHSGNRPLKLGITLAAGERGEYCFRLPEDLAESSDAQIFVYIIGLSVLTDEALKAATTSELNTKAPGLAPMWEDEIQIEINGQSIPVANLRRVYHAEGRAEKFSRPLPAYTSLWLDLETPPAVNGDNTLGVTLVTASDGPVVVVIDEVEVVVMPKPVGAP